MNSITYAIPYIILTIFYIVMGVYWYYSENVIRNYIKVTCIVVYLLFFGFRGFIGYDWVNYYSLFNIMPTLFEGNLDQFSAVFFEPGFIFLFSLLKTIYPDYHFCIFVFSAINIVLLTKFLDRYSYNFPWGVALFLCFGGSQMQIDLIRNSISILLFLLSLKYVFSRNIFGFYVINLLGFFFHMSAIFYFPLYFIINRQIPRIALVLLFIAGNILFLLQIEYVKPIILFVANIIGGKAAYIVDFYFIISKKAYGITIGYLERVITAGLIIIYYNKLILNNPYNRVFINGYIIYFIMFFYFSEFVVISSRLGVLFLFSYWILWPEILKCINLRNNKILFVSFIWIYVLFRTIGFYSPILYRYDNVLFGITSRFERATIFKNYQRINNK